MNCQHGILVADIWTFCKHRGEKVSYSDCKNCGSWLPYDPDYEPDSFVTINVYGLSNTEREKRQERHSLQDLLKGDIPRQPVRPRIPQLTTFLDGLLKSFAKAQKKGDVFDAIEIHPKREREP